LKHKNETIEIKNAPEIPGLVFRSLRGSSDFPHLVRIFNDSNKADNTDQFLTLENLENNYKHMERSNTDRDLVIVEIRDEPVGYGRCMWDAEHDGKYTYSFFLHMVPQYRIKGLGEAVVEFFLQRLLEISTEHPANAPKYFQSWGVDSQIWFTGLLKTHNFEAVRYGIEMTRPCKQPVDVSPLPEGIVVRQPAPQEIRKVWDAKNEAFRDHFGFFEPTEKDYQNWISSTYFDPGLWKVAWDGEEVAGMVLNLINRDENEQFDRKRGYTENICVVSHWRRRGIARGLLTRSIKMFQEMNIKETALGVDTDNPNDAVKLYKDVGYIEQKRFMTYRKKLINT